MQMDKQQQDSRAGIIRPTDWTQIERKQPFGKYAFVDVTFPPERNVDIPIYPGFSVENPSNWRWIEVKQRSLFYDTTTGYYGNQEGAFEDIAYSAGNFTASGSMTWGVAEADINTYGFVVRGQMCRLVFDLRTTTTGGTPSTELRLYTGGFGATKTVRTPIWVHIGGVAEEAGWAQISPGNLYVQIFRAGSTAAVTWPNADKLVDISGSIEWPIGVEFNEQPAEIYQSPSPTAVQSSLEFLSLRCNKPSYSTRLLVFEERS